MVFRLAISPVRAGFTLVELLVSITITAIIAASVATTVSAVGVGMQGQDEAAQEVARLARGQARLADHLFRSRMILSESATVATLWLPSEAFDGSATNAADYDTIHGNELRWYLVDRTNRVISMQRLTNTLNRTVYPLATDWSALRTSLASSGALVTTTVLEGVLEGAFRFTAFNPCADRRLVLDIQLDDEHGGMHFEIGGIIDALQRHSDCQ
jgi:prepilin-type N-terminal cleavage/methylation domain-containing protein